MSSRLLRRAPLALGLTGLLAMSGAGSASAAMPPDRSFVLSSSVQEVKWDGTQAQGSYFHVGPVNEFDPEHCSKESDAYCEHTLIEVRSGGPVKLDATAGEFSSAIADFDLNLYKSDAAGKIGEEVETSGEGPGTDEALTVPELQPGFYLVQVVYFFSPNASYKGSVKITGATPAPGGDTPPPPSGGGGTTPPPSSGGGGGTTPPPSSGGGTTTPPPSSGPMALPFKASSALGSFKKAKKKKAFTVKATVGKDITSLIVRLVPASGKGKVLAEARIAKLAAGKRVVKLKLKSKKIKPGKYKLVSVGTVDGQGASTSQAVKVKK